MPFDFSAAGRSARELIPVPEVPMKSIRERSYALSARARVRAFVIGGALSLATLGTAAAVGTGALNGVRVWLSGGKASMSVSSLAMVRQPTASDLRNVIAHATFPVVLPVGIPAGTRVDRMLFAPAGAPNTLTLDYRNPGSGLDVGISLFETASINPQGTPPPASGVSGAVYQWRVAKETIIVSKAHISPGDFRRIKAAMMKTSASESLAATQAFLHKVVLLGGTTAQADVAEHLAPASGMSVLIDPQRLRSAHSISALVQAHRPLLDSRTVYLTNIPAASGAPDFSKATLSFPKNTAISADGVRAIDAALRTIAPTGNCGCALLFNQPNSATYWIWEIPLPTPSAAAKYSVDAKTLVVTKLP